MSNKTMVDVVFWQQLSKDLIMFKENDGSNKMSKTIFDSIKYYHYSFWMHDSPMEGVVCEISEAKARSRIRNERGLNKLPGSFMIYQISESEFDYHKKSNKLPK